MALIFGSCQAFFGFSNSDEVLRWGSYAGIALSVLLVTNILNRTALLLLALLYLSFVNMGQGFLSFQWDAFLIEANFIALFLSSRLFITIFLGRLLIFKFMLLSGIVKLSSGDIAWHELTALYYHFETQPLPNPFSWYAHHLPPLFLEIGTAATLFLELITPFFMLLTRRLRHLAAWGTILLQCTILLTGNYNFFNLLTLVVCLLLFDDHAIQHLLPKWKRFIPPPPPMKQLLAESYAPAKKQLAMAMLLSPILLLNVLIFNTYLKWEFTESFISPIIGSVQQFGRSWYLANHYGPFSVMTRTRPEIIIEGSYDGKHWHDYKFRYKPDERLDKKLPIAIPHQPRLDWQLWFAALRNEPPYWFIRLIEQLLIGSPTVLALFDHNPFEKLPPKYIRAHLYDYRFTTLDERANSNEIWKRTNLRHILKTCTAQISSEYSNYKNCRY